MEPKLNHLQPARADTPLPPTVALSIQDLTKLIVAEANSIPRIDNSLVEIEKYLLNPRNMGMMSEMQLMSLYDLMLKRKSQAQGFLAKMLDMGIKSSYLSSLMDSAEQEQEKVQPPTRKAQELRSKIQQVLAGKIAEIEVGGVQLKENTEEVENGQE